MWRDILNALRKLVLLQEQTDKNTAEMKELRQELKDLSSVVQSLSFHVRRSAENESHEREKMALRLENILLKSDRFLPSPGEG